MGRLDAELVARGLVSGRDRAASLIREGRVRVNGRTAAKPAMQVTEADALEADDTPYVSRGGLKLAGALQTFGLDVRGLTAVDLGASTGGFTDCLLHGGAAKVWAVDVGHDQLAAKLREDPRVVPLEGLDARRVTRETVGGQSPDLVVTDLSFISLKGVFPAISALLDEAGRCVALIKPQFEAGRAAVGKNGVVRDKTVHARVLREVDAAAREAGLYLQRICESPIRGGEGNTEYLALYAKTPGPGEWDWTAVVRGAAR